LNETLTASQDPFASSLTGRRLGRYEVLARLASGGMAGVYVARALGVAGFERLVAVKVLHPHLAHEEEFISMFLDEARLAARIRHPNVVPTIDISDTPDAGFYLVMEYIEGDHLGALLQRAWKLGKRLPFSVTLRIIVDALEGLGAAHNLTDEAGRPLQLVHRDVSPHNIMVSTDGVARITDFGVAKAEVRLSTTREGQFKGKLAYMAPEHASNGDADQRSDLFSMAIILWESLAGKRLFRAENQAATLNKICLEPIPMPSSVDPALAVFDPILERGLARDPNLRYQSAEEFAEAIEESASMLGGLAKQREVAQLVREYAAEKLSKDAELIRDAISQLATHSPSEPPAGISAPISPEPPPLPPAPRVFAPPPAAAASGLNVPVPPAYVPPAQPQPHPQHPQHPQHPSTPMASEVFSQLREPLPLLDLEPHEAQVASKRWVWAAAIFTLAAAIGVAVLLSMRDDRVRPVPLPAAMVETAPPQAVPIEPPPIPTMPTEPAKPAPGHDARSATGDRPARRTPPEPRENTEPSAQTPTPDEATPVEALEAAEPTPPPRETPPTSTTSTTPRREPREPRRPRDAEGGTQPVRPPPDDLMLNPYR
jgi:serine/threonine protein kinase